ncbi:MAG TPA: 3'-5' exonuclease [Clostridiaceae bacterium]|nr:3'-5' exonuclease [Clostridiaceae bacterium]
MKGQKGNRLVCPQNDYVVIDTETTGVNIYTSEIIELAALKVVNGEVVDTFQSLVKPDNPIPLEVTYINDITNEMVKDAPKLDSVLCDYLDFLGDSVLVGHNINIFDLNILNNASLNLYGHVLSNDFVDTMYLARCCIHGQESYTLSSIADYLRVQVKFKHRALDDCITTYKCYECYEKMKHMELKNYFTDSNSKKGPRWRNKFER